MLVGGSRQEKDRRRLSRAWDDVRRSYQRQRGPPKAEQETPERSQGLSGKPSTVFNYRHERKLGLTASLA